MNPDGEARHLPAKCTLEVRHGDVFRHLLAGAGGWGDPHERDVELVLTLSTWTSMDSAKLNRAGREP